MLLLVAYTTVFQYLFFLREISHLLSPLGTQAVVYLAAAVSDFYIHPANMVGQLEASARSEDHRSLFCCLTVTDWVPVAVDQVGNCQVDSLVILASPDLAYLIWWHHAFRVTSYIPFFPLLTVWWAMIFFKLCVFMPHLNLVCVLDPVGRTQNTVLGTLGALFQPHTQDDCALEERVGS